MQKAQSSPHLASVALSDQNVKSTNHYKYLGTVLDTEFSDNKNIQTTAIIDLCIKQAGASFSRCSNAVPRTTLPRTKKSLAGSSLTAAPACTNGVWPPLRPVSVVWRRRTNRRPCRPPMSNPSTSPWTA